MNTLSTDAMVVEVAQGITCSVRMYRTAKLTLVEVERSKHAHVSSEPRYHLSPAATDILRRLGGITGWDGIRVPRPIKSLEFIEDSMVVIISDGFSWDDIEPRILQAFDGFGSEPLLLRLDEAARVGSNP